MIDMLILTHTLKGQRFAHKDISIPLCWLLCLLLLLTCTVIANPDNCTDQ